MGNTQTVHDVPILRASGEVTAADLDAIAAASKQLDYAPALTLGEAETGSPAYGWVQNLRRRGDQLLADVETAHVSVAEALRGKKYSRLAAHVFEMLKRGGKQFRRALKAISLHGVPAPATAPLVPSGVMEFADGASYEALRTFTLDEPESRRAAGDAVDAAVRALQRQHFPQQISYQQALEQVLADDPALAEAYAHGPRATVKSNAADSADPVHVIVDREARRWMAALGVSYDRALARALSERPDLAAEYCKFGFGEEDA